MELFLDDPNLDIETEDRNRILNAYYFALISTVLPVINILISFLYLNKFRRKNTFMAGHFKNLISIQTLVLIFILVALVLFFIIDVFYVLLFGLFIILFQSIFIYNGIVAAKHGTINNLPISFNI